MFRTTLFPNVNPHKTGLLPLDALHQMYWEESGNPNGVPVVVIHGGPGGGSSPLARGFFDPDHYRIIQYDQRGAGKSLPYGELENNTTPHLIEDIETLRKHLGVEKWYVFGGSWGVTLGLAYAEAYPERCLGLIFRGVFLCRESEFEWFLWGARNIFPEEHQKLIAHLKEEDRGDWRSILKAYHKLLTDSDQDTRNAAAHVWSRYEGAIATLLPNQGVVQTFENYDVAYGLARMEATYFLNNIFLPENHLLDNVDRVRSIPTIIIHGRYDIVCPIVSAYDLVQKWPEADFRLISEGGHSPFDPKIQEALLAATEEFKLKDQQHNQRAIK